MGELNRLKAWLCQKRIKYRKEKDRAERCQEKEEDKVTREAQQPALFKF